MFKLFKLRSYYLRLLRGFGIAYILFGFFLVNWMSRYKLTSKLIPRRYKKNRTVISSYARLRMVIERLGPTFVKFGQILADRPDILSENFRRELKPLQYATEPFDHELARELIEKELGTPIDSIFAAIDSKTIGSASIGQVYGAVLKGGERVIVKIQRPSIREKIILDLQLLEYVADKLSGEYPELSYVNIKGFVKEFGEQMMNELNYLYEAGNAMRFADMFIHVPYCKIPKVYLNLCTHKLLVMEYVEGVSPFSARMLREHGFDPNEVVSHGTHIFLKMIFEHGFFHADPHAGNFFVQEHNRVALIDFGMVGALKPSHMQFLALFTHGLATKNAQAIANALLDLSGMKFFKEKEDLEFHVHEMLNRYWLLPYENIRFSQVLDECVKILLRYKIQIPGSIFLLLKALASIEKMGAQLNSDISLASYIRPYATALIKKQYSARALAGDLFDVMRDFITLAKTFPSEVSEILHKAKSGMLIHKLEPETLEVFHSTVSHMGRRLSTVMLIGFMFAGSIVVNMFGTPNAYNSFIFILSSVLATWLMLKLFFKTSV